MNSLLKILCISALMLILGCEKDDLFNDAQMLPADSTRTSFSSNLRINYHERKGMFDINGKSPEHKEYIYSEDGEFEKKTLTKAYNQEVEPLTVYGEIPE